jgi:hypothetical protein
LPATTERTKIKIATSTAVQLRRKPINTNGVKKNNNYNNKNFKEECHTCMHKADKKFSMENVVASYCNSQIALRGRVQYFKESQFDLNVKRRRQAVVQQAKVLSMHIIVPRRDRKLFKGSNILFDEINVESSNSSNNNFLTEKNLRKLNRLHNSGNNVENENTEHLTQTVLFEKFSKRKELDFYLLSNYHLNLIKNRRRKNNNSNESKRNSNNKQEYCTCDIVSNQLNNRRQNTNAKYFMMANVLRIKENMVKRQQNRSIRNDRTRFMNLINNDNNNNNMIINSNNEMNLNKFRIVHITGIFKWNRVRPLIDYLENYSIDKQNMCQNIKQTVVDINKAQLMFF